MKRDISIMELELTKVEWGTGNNNKQEEVKQKVVITTPTMEILVDKIAINHIEKPITFLYLEKKESWFKRFCKIFNL